MVVAGWWAGHGSRTGRLGGLLLGYHDPTGALRYAGRVGSGLSHTETGRLTGLLADLATDRDPFDPPLPRPLAQPAHWAPPELAVEVAYGEWSTDGTHRHPSYLGLRHDKNPTEVTRED